MTDLNEERTALLRQLSSVEQESQREIEERIGLWGFAFIRARVQSGPIAISYIAFNVVGIGVGIYLIVLGATPRVIGIALTVGSILAFGAFVAQWWTVAVQREVSIMDASRQESDAALWHELYLKKTHIQEQLKALDAETKDHPST
jgi:hypothetical protein